MAFTRCGVFECVDFERGGVPHEIFHAGSEVGGFRTCGRRQAR